MSRNRRWRRAPLLGLVVALTGIFVVAGDSVDGLNLGFEGKTASWYLGGDGYVVEVIDGESHSGTRALRMTCEKLGEGFGVATGRFPVDEARGKRLRLSGYIKTADIQEGWAGLWMRVDGPDGILGFDNMQSRGVRGTTDWMRYEIVLEVPEEAININFGALLTGDGTAWVDSLAFEVIEPLPAVVVTVQGIAYDPEGKPVTGAHVALVAPMSDRAAARSVTDDEGRFSLDVQSGEYAITASGSGLTVYLEPEVFGPDRERETAIVLQGGGITFTGAVKDEADRPVTTTPIKVYRISDDVGDIFYSRTDDEGRYSVTVVPGAGYVLLVESDDYTGESTRIGVDGETTVDLAVVRRAAAADEVIAWIRGNAVPLKTAEAGHGFEDMDPLREIVGDARVVGLGEATHGTREFFQLKHRMLEFLVERMGFTVFAIEANWPEALAINDYVLHGEGDAGEALDGIYFWTWNTEEVLELIEWMRRYNADPSNSPKIKFYGFDMQFSPVAARAAVAYFRTVDPGYATGFEKAIAPLESDRAREEFSGLSADRRKAVIDAVDEALERLDTERDRWVAKTGEREWVVARQQVVILSQAAAMYGQGGFGGGHERDRAMAANVEWILETEPAGTRVVAWAHNGHVSRDPKSLMQPMGMHLARSLGDGYVVFGFAFNRGSFQAIDWSRGQDQSGGLAEHTVGPAPVGNIGAELSRAGLSIFVLDLRELVDGSPAARWFSVPHPMRQIGAVFSGERAMSYPIVLPAHYDCIIFVDETTRARPVEHDRAEEGSGGQG